MTQLLCFTNPFECFLVYEKCVYYRFRKSITIYDFLTKKRQRIIPQSIGMYAGGGGRGLILCFFCFIPKVSVNLSF